MANDIKTDEIIGDFKVTEVTPLYEQDETAVMLSHGPTGLQWLHFIADDPVSSCAIGITTPVSDDRGIPHVLEHMVLGGSRRWPGTDLVRAMQNRTVAQSMGSDAYPFFTVYHFDSAVESDMRAIFEVWFDAILRPELSDDTFRREAGRLRPQDLYRPDGPITYTGNVFDEMCKDKGNLSDKIIGEARRHLVPDNGLGFDIDGRPAAIMSLTPDDVRAYHKRWYCPANMRIVTRGREMPRALFGIADKLLDGVEAGEAAPPFAPQPRWNAPRTAEIAVSASESVCSDDEEEEMPNQGLIWLLPDASDYRASMAVDIFVNAFNLAKIIDAAARPAVIKDDAFGQVWRRPCPTPGPDFTMMFRRIGPDKFLGVYGNFDPIYPGETLWTRTERELRKLFDDPETARRFAAEAGKRAEWISNVTNDGSGLSELAHDDAFKWIFHNWLFKDNPFHGLVSSRPLSLCRQFERDPDSVVEIIRDLLLDNPHCLDIAIRESEGRPGRADIEHALAEMSAKISKEDRLVLATRERDIPVYANTTPAGEPLPETTIADIPDDLFAIPFNVTKPSCGTTFLNVKADTTGRAFLAGFADLSDFTSEQMLIVPFIVKEFCDPRSNVPKFQNHSIDAGSYAGTGILDGVRRRGIKFMVPIERGTEGLRPGPVEENHKSALRFFSNLFQRRDPLPYEKAQNMIETGEMLRNPARWTFALIGPRYLTKPVNDSLLLALGSAPNHPIGPAAEQKSNPKKQDEEAKETPGIAGKQAALDIAKRLVNSGKSSRDLISRCLDDYLCGVTPKRIREALERISLK